MSTLAEKRLQIKTILSTVAGIGRVHEYERWAKDITKFKALYQDADKRINGWTITRSSSGQREGASMTVNTSDLFIIRGYYGVEDEAASELAFQDLIESIRIAFQNKWNLNGYAESLSPDFGPGAVGSGVQVRVVDYRLFFGILVHYCELVLGVQDQTDI
ncbi:MAG TPA: hypothetical protein PKM59_01970 [Thermodesulfobacteriota bacterium]|nr:hypothetical protein [Thermodesulfobacteriota bacterium]HNU70580.1 hypothetical protein [Thermodesulfobacteriota bacterium]